MNHIKVTGHLLFLCMFYSYLHLLMMKENDYLVVVVDKEQKKRKDSQYTTNC